MNILKVFKDNIVKSILGKDSFPRGLYDASEYFRHNEPIEFEFYKEDNIIVAVSKNFRYGSIITQAKNETELDDNIKDAILTSFEIPSSYRKEASIRSVGENSKEYVLA